MKVRCIDNENIYYGMLSLGTIYEVHNRNQFNYEVIDDSGRYIYFNKERFEEVNEELDFVKEVVEECLKEKELREKNKTEKTFREVIADIKEGEVWECLGIKITKDSDSIQMLGFGKNTIFMDSSRIFNLQRKEYTFEEAYKKAKEGAEIQSLASNIKYKKYDENTMMFKDKDMDDFAGISNDNAIFSVDEIQGKWYINN